MTKITQPAGSILTSSAVLVLIVSFLAAGSAAAQEPIDPSASTVAPAAPTPAASTPHLDLPSKQVNSAQIGSGTAILVLGTASMVVSIPIFGLGWGLSNAFSDGNGGPPPWPIFGMVASQVAIATGLALLIRGARYRGRARAAIQPIAMPMKGGAWGGGVGGVF